MQIEKINENKLEVIINVADLEEKDITLQSFMSETIENQSLFLEILNFADKQVGFNLKNCEIIVEAFSIPSKNSFILIITRIPSSSALYLSKTKYSRLKLNKSFWFKFNDFETLCAFCNLFPKNINVISSLYLLEGNYFIHLEFSHLKDLIRVMLIGSEFSDCIYDSEYLIDENAQTIIKDYAIKTCQKFFV
ncbi:MAG: adaptor protein MecA [Clostridia bacterium]